MTATAVSPEESDREHHGRVLVINQNNSLPSDRRVWNEITTLRRAGYDISAISPIGETRDRELFEQCDGVPVHRYRQLSADAHGAVGYVLEFAVAMLRIRRLVRQLARTCSFAVVHVSNPPDLLLLTALSLRRRGVRMIFDHHDLAPELYLARFGRRKDVFYWLSRLAEFVSFRLADVVIATNESYRSIAMKRGRKRLQDTFVVRSAPRLERFVAVPEDPVLRRGRPHLLAFIGDIAPQDGVDRAIRAFAALHEVRDDWHAVIAGNGPALPALRDLVAELALDGQVEFAGWLGDRELRTLLCTADVCVVPDPRTPLSDQSTLVKLAEYLAMSRPVVASDLRESRVTAGEAALYADSDDPAAFAGAIARLLDDPDQRRRMGELGRARIEAGLAWEHSAIQLLAAYDHVLTMAR